MALHNSQQPPRALFVDFDDTFLKSSRLSALFNASMSIRASYLSKVRQGEYDVIITRYTAGSDLGPIEPHLYVINLGGSVFPTVMQGELTVTPYKGHEASVSTELETDDTLQGKLSTLVVDTLVPAYNAISSKPALTAISELRHNSGSAITAVYIPQKHKLWHSVVSDPDGKCLSGYYKRGGSDAEVWSLPGSLKPKQCFEWVEALLQRWAASRPETFSQGAEWKKSPIWQSPAERELVGQLENEKQDFERQQEKYLKAKGDMEASLLKESSTADGLYRKLLTSSNDELKNVAKACLLDLGFDVVDIDEQREQNDLLEDLQVSIKAKDWIALVEVRSHKGGAKASDITKIGRHVSSYQEEHGGARPNAAWYLVNHSREKNPTTRPLAMKDNARDVKLFAEGYNGLIIDTTILFRLWMDVLSGARSKQEVQQLLIEQTGILTYPAS